MVSAWDEVVKSNSGEKKIHVEAAWKNATNFIESKVLSLLFLRKIKKGSGKVWSCNIQQ